MSEGRVNRIVLSLSLLFISFTSVLPQEDAGLTVRLMFYNVENLFDTYNDPLTDDDEFLPDSPRRWTNGRYNRKIASVFKTIVAAGEWEPPAIVALCEVENRKILSDIINTTYLSKYDYGIIHEDSPDPRGIDVCMIYRKDIARIIDYRYLMPELPQGQIFTSRKILYARMSIHSDTIHLFVNHWPSRRGGVLAGEELRRLIAEKIRYTADSVNLSCRGRSKIILMGDFNANPDDVSINILTKKKERGVSVINLSENLPDRSGTYRYMGTWETIDQIIVSDYFLTCSGGLSTNPELCMVFRSGFLLKSDTRYPGLSPFSTYSGYHYQGGFSDHLPVVLDLIFK